VTKGLIALTPEIDCDQTGKGIPPVTTAVFTQSQIIVVEREISEMSLVPLRGIKREWYVCMCVQRSINSFKYPLFL
jgi:hypothetical protein